MGSTLQVLALLIGIRGSWEAVQTSQEAWNTKALREGLGPDAWPGGECMDDLTVFYCFLPITGLAGPRKTLCFSVMGSTQLSNSKCWEPSELEGSLKLI